MLHQLLCHLLELPQPQGDIASIKYRQVLALCIEDFNIIKHFLRFFFIPGVLSYGFLSNRRATSAKPVLLLPVVLLGQT